MNNFILVNYILGDDRQTRSWGLGFSFAYSLPCTQDIDSQNTSIISTFVNFPCGFLTIALVDYLG
jgi:hypothetical protein